MVIHRSHPTLILASDPTGPETWLLSPVICWAIFDWVGWEGKGEVSLNRACQSLSEPPSTFRPRWKSEQRNSSPFALFFNGGGKDVDTYEGKRKIALNRACLALFKVTFLFPSFPCRYYWGVFVEFQWICWDITQSWELNPCVPSHPEQFWHWEFVDLQASIVKDDVGSEFNGVMLIPSPLKR